MQTATSQRASGIAGRVLLVISNENFRRTLSRILARCGYPVECATSGEDALQRLETGSFRAVVSDVHLPGQVCGLTLLQQLRAAGRTIPMIFLTEEATARLRAALESIQGVECLPVPLDIDRLKEIVARLLAKGGGRSP